MDCLRGGHCERESAIDNVSLSFHCFQNVAVLHVVQSLSSDRNVLFLFVVLKISLFFLPFSHDLVIRMFHCLVITLKMSLFSVSSGHDPVTECSIVFSLLRKSHCSPYHQCNDFDFLLSSVFSMHILSDVVYVYYTYITYLSLYSLHAAKSYIYI